MSILKNPLLQNIRFTYKKKGEEKYLSVCLWLCLSSISGEEKNPCSHFDQMGHGYHLTLNSIPIFNSYHFNIQLCICDHIEASKISQTRSVPVSALVFLLFFFVRTFSSHCVCVCALALLLHDILLFCYHNS